MTGAGILKNQFRAFCETLRFRIFLLFLLFVMAFAVVFSSFFTYAVKNMKEKIETSYDSMLSIYIGSIQNQIEDIDTYLYNLKSDFDLNMMTIEDSDADEYLMSKFRAYANIRSGYTFFGMLDCVYIYDSRNDSILTIPDDEGGYQEIGERIIEKDGETTGWEILDNDAGYVLARCAKISDFLWVAVFVELDDLLQELKITAAADGLLWEVTAADGTILYGTNVEDVGNGKKGLFSGTIIERQYDELGMIFYLYIDSTSVWIQNIWAIVFFPIVMFLFVVLVYRANKELGMRFLRPLGKLIEGMQDFANGNEEASVEKNSAASRELSFTIDTFNGMVRQIKETRFQVYEEKLEKQKLLIQNLQSQVNPHFFSNTMNMIYNLIAAKRIDTAEKGLLLLSSYYRYMTRSDQERIELKREFTFIGDYLEIMKLRFPSTLSAAVHLDGELRDFQIPPMLIQPLAENSIKHGFSDRRQKFEIRVTAEAAEEDMEICVADNGGGFPEGMYGSYTAGRDLAQCDETEDNHVGLENVYKRLLYLYGGNARMTISRKEGWSIVCLAVHDWKNFMQ